MDMLTKEELKLVQRIMQNIAMQTVGSKIELHLSDSDENYYLREAIYRLDEEPNDLIIRKSGDVYTIERCYSITQ